jgi:hypothetical protein
VDEVQRRSIRKSFRMCELNQTLRPTPDQAADVAVGSRAVILEVSILRREYPRKLPDCCGAEVDSSGPQPASRTAPKASSFNHVVGDCEHAGRDDEPKRFRRAQVDHEFELG